MLGLAAAREGLDDEHASAAAGARTRQHARLGLGCVGRFGLTGTASSSRARAMLAARCEPLELQRLFDQWLGPSEDLRQYLWAHRNEQIQVAQQLINILPSVALVHIVQYL